MILYFLTAQALLLSSILASDAEAETSKADVPVPLAAASTESPSQSPLLSLTQRSGPDESKTPTDTARNLEVPKSPEHQSTLLLDPDQYQYVFQTPPNRKPSRKRTRLDALQRSSGDGDGTDGESSSDSITGEFNQEAPSLKSRTQFGFIIGGSGTAHSSTLPADAVSNDPLIQNNRRVIRLFNAMLTSLSIANWKIILAQDIADHGPLNTDVAKYLISQATDHRKLATLWFHSQHLLPDLVVLARTIISSAMEARDWDRAFVTVYHYQYMPRLLLDDLKLFWKVLVAESMRVDLIRAVDQTLPSVKADIVQHILRIMIHQVAHRTIDEFRGYYFLLDPLTLQMTHFKPLIEKMIVDVNNRVLPSAKLEMLFGLLQRKFQHSPSDMVYILIYASVLGDAYLKAVSSLWTKEYSEYALEHRNHVIHVVSQTPTARSKLQVMHSFVTAVTIGNKEMMEQWFFSIIGHPDCLDSYYIDYFSAGLRNLRPIAPVH